MTFNLADLFERVAHAVPGRVAIIHGPTRLTYAALDLRADMVATSLHRAGVGRGDRVGLALRNGPEYLELMLAAFKLSAVPVNINYRYRRAELAQILEDSGAKVLVHEEDLTSELAGLTDELDALELTIRRGSEYEDWVASSPPSPPPTVRSGDDLYVLYTGGTTGTPRGVVWRHEDIFFAAMGGGARGSEQIEAPEEITQHLAQSPNRVLAASPLMHGTAHWFAFLTLFAGGTVVLAASATLDPVELLDLVDREGISYLVVVGDAFAAPMADLIRSQPERWDLTSLTVIVSGGATLSAPIRRSLISSLPWIIVVDGYGTSETGGQATMVYTAGMEEGSTEISFNLGTETTVVDSELRPVRAGSGDVGHVARFGRVPLGYHDDPEATSRTFPVRDGVRWAVTGDQATIDAEGRMVLLGRGSSTINSGGEKIHPEEIEAVLREHPEVVDAVVVGVPDERWGERVAAVVAARPGAAIDLEMLESHCRARLAGFKTPRSLVVVPEVSRLESGKPDYRWAREVASESC